MNGYNFGVDVRRTLQQARNEAHRLRHGYVGAEHILLGVLHETSMTELLTRLSVDPVRVRQDVESTLVSGDASLATRDFPYDRPAKKILELSMAEAREMNHSDIGAGHVLLAVLQEGKSNAAQALGRAGLKRDDVRAELLRNPPRADPEEAQREGEGEPRRRTSGVSHGFNFTDRVRRVLQLAREEAIRLHHEYVGTEHILLGLVREGEGVAAAVLQSFHIDLADVVQRVESIVKLGKAEGHPLDLPYTSRAKKVLELAMNEVRELNHEYIGTEHLLLGLLREEKGIAAQVLSDLGLDHPMTRAETLRLLGSPDVQGDDSREVPLRILDQRFKTVIALIELHHGRFGSYPDSLDDLQFPGAFDISILKTVRYEKLSDGYGLDLLWPKFQKSHPSYPPDFWRGLGIRRTNVGRSDT